eukprot:359816-Rhodomonas_salina.1
MALFFDFRGALGRRMLEEECEYAEVWRRRPPPGRGPFGGLFVCAMGRCTRHLQLAVVHQYYLSHRY